MFLKYCFINEKWIQKVIENTVRYDEVYDIGLAYQIDKGSMYSAYPIQTSSIACYCVLPNYFSLLYGFKQ